MAFSDASGTALVSRRNVLGFLASLPFGFKQKSVDSLPTPKFKIGQRVIYRWWDDDYECWSYEIGIIHGLRYKPDEWIVPVTWIYYVFVTNSSFEQDFYGTHAEYMEEEMELI